MAKSKQTGDSQVSETGNELINAAGINESAAKSNENPGGDPGPAAGEPGAEDSTIPLPAGTSEATDEKQPGGAEITIDQAEPSHLPPLQSEPTLDFKIQAFANGITAEPTEVVEAIAKIAGEELLRRSPTPESVNLTEQQLNDLESLSLHEQRVKQYGENYVLAKNGERETIFTRTAWNNLSGTKDGWKEEVATPPEVLALNK